MNDNYKNIDKFIQDNEIEEAVEYIENLSYEEYRKIIGMLITQLQATDIIRIRHNLALIFSDLKCDDAVEPLVELIKSPKCAKCRGTLIYALQELNSSEYIVELFPLFFEGNYETKCNLFTLLENQKKNMVEKDVSFCTNLLQKRINEYEQDLELFYEIGETFFGLNFE